jgi:hypothetical protein
MRNEALATGLLACLLTLSPVTASARDIDTLTGLLASSDGESDHRAVATALDELRAMGRAGAPAGDTLSALLAHRASLYAGRDKVLVVRLRAQLFVTLAAVGPPPSALPALYDTLAHPDERINAREIGAAVRAARALGAAGHVFAPYLIDLLDLQLGEEEFSLERYDLDFPRHEATTVQLEVVRALAAIAPPDDPQVLTALRQLADRGASAVDPRVANEARRALLAIDAPQP